MRQPVGKPRIVHYSLADMPRGMYVQCIRLNMHQNGAMQRRMNRYHNHFKAEDDYAVCLTDSQDWLLGWVLIFKVREMCPDAGYNEPLDTQHSYYYIRRTLRERGYGTLLHKYVNERWPQARVHPWEPVSRAFFAEMGRAHDYREHPGQRFKPPRVG